MRLILHWLLRRPAIPFGTAAAIDRREQDAARRRLLALARANRADHRYVRHIR
ncbi:hypothetical protein [Micromonospora sp. WMMD1082]|uniref:hypothetical protein n=1 Tax=Micromonospora sp. WMMD1082 TaxID=3016104 RepID=UPI0024172164|nr:hypothetical protein [Micromonospora sp. WMMD1082]MDG4796235.1 hypothetical protein [Micromonospora sp. WMMD1082]